MSESTAGAGALLAGVYKIAKDQASPLQRELVAEVREQMETMKYDPGVELYESSEKSAVGGVILKMTPLPLCL